MSGSHRYAKPKKYKRPRNKLNWDRFWHGVKLFVFWIFLLLLFAWDYFWIDLAIKGR